jgi:beta-mannanase
MKYAYSLFMVVTLLLAGCGADNAAVTATPASTPTPEATRQYEAIPGVFLGRYHGTPDNGRQFDQEIGKSTAIHLYFPNWQTRFHPALYRNNAAAGRITMATWEYEQFPDDLAAAYRSRALEAILEGEFDAYIDQWARGLGQFGRPVLMRWGHEMNGNWYPWSGAQNGGGQLDGFGDPTRPDGPERFVAAYRYLKDRFDAAGADDVLWVWCPNAPFEAMLQFGEWNRAENYYPGDDYVDWLCMDGYNWGSSPFGQQFNSRWESFDQIFRQSYEALQALNPEKPIMIGEFASTEDGGDKAAWIRDAYERIRHDYPQIRAAVWFHVDKETDWRINSSPQSLQAFREAVADDYWLEEWPGMRE